MKPLLFAEDLARTMGGSGCRSGQCVDVDCGGVLGCENHPGSPVLVKYFPLRTALVLFCGKCLSPVGRPIKVASSGGLS